MSDLTCPKCHGQMRVYERNGVTVDQCADCRGLFLDRGELEKLVDAENSWHGAPPAAAPPAAAPPLYEQPRHQSQPYVQQGYAQQGYGHKPHKKRKSFLSELFDD
jgi:Zn-finger nucleic acid-binding protein